MEHCARHPFSRCGRQAAASGPGGRAGLTLVELLITLVCLAVAAVIVLPVAMDGASTQLRAAADLLVADLEYARSESMSHADDPRLVVVNSGTNTYHIATRSAPSTPVTDPINRGAYSTTYGSGRAATLPRVRVTAYSLGGDNRLMFRGLGELDQTTPATITLAAAARSVTITLDPVTGEPTVGAIQ